MSRVDGHSAGGRGTADAETDWAPGRPIPLRSILGPLRRGAGDPTWRVHEGAIWRGSMTPDGPVTVRIWREPVNSGQDSQAGQSSHDNENGSDGADRALLRAWGPGASWCARAFPASLGQHDDMSAFEVHHEQLRDAALAARHWRMGRTGLVLESLVPAIIEQRVTGKQAFSAYRTLVQRFGTAAPGPGAELGLRCPPDASGWRAIPSWHWLRAGVDAQRADTIMRVGQVAHRIEECVDLPLPAVWKRLSSIPGVGVWTIAETVQRSLGDADAVSFGDYHVAADICWALTGVVGDDLQAEQLLAPYAGHRYRVQHLVNSGGLTRPRHGARLALPTHLPRG